MNPIPLYDRIPGAVRLARVKAGQSGIRQRVSIHFEPWTGSYFEIGPVDAPPVASIAVPMIYRESSRRADRILALLADDRPEGQS